MVHTPRQSMIQARESYEAAWYVVPIFKVQMIDRLTIRCNTRDSLHYLPDNRGRESQGRSEQQIRIFSSLEARHTGRRWVQSTNSHLMVQYLLCLHSAHTIRNHQTSTAQAVAALRATSRWAVSGTPIQNSPLDLHGLFKFLQFAPYDDPKVFENDITKIWHVRSSHEAAKTFKKLLSCVMLRRTKAVLDLPIRDDKLMRVSFSHDEMKHYRRIEQPVMDMLDRTAGTGSQTQVLWMTAIQQVNKLRLVCNLGLFVPSESSYFPQPGDTEKKRAMMKYRPYILGGGLCEQCMEPVEATSFGCDTRDAMQPQVYYSACGKFYCAACSARLQHLPPKPCACTKNPRLCQLLPLVFSSSAPSIRLPGSLLQPNNLNDRTSVMKARSSMDGGSCELCLQPVETSPPGSGLRDLAQPQVYYSACSKFYCSECSVHLQYRSAEPCACIEQPRPCRLRPLASFLATSSLTPPSSLQLSSMDWDYANDISSKVWALVSQIRSCPQEKQ
jgi:hypothetical protein